MAKRHAKKLSSCPRIRTSQFDYSLPKEFIAQSPLTPRDASKLMVFNTYSHQIFHKKFSDIKSFFKKGDVLVINKSKVIPVRIIFEKDEKKCEIFILKKLTDNFYEVFVKPGKYFRNGSEFKVAEFISCKVENISEDGTRIVSFKSISNIEKPIDSMLEKIGQMPLPPYIKNSNVVPSRYQTVYAKEKGSVAAPTAGLHFTNRLIKELKNIGVQFEEVILHVGRGTFMPVKTEFIDDHKMHCEVYKLSEKTALNLNKAKAENRRIIAVGTTSVRVLETVYASEHGFSAKAGETNIFIYPGHYKWSVIDGLITNFHLPKSTLLMLVASFLESKGIKAPIKKLLDLYEIAKKNNYRFYSFGDAMFLL